MAVNALSNIGPLSINYAVEEAGGDSTIKYVEVPFPDMIAALEAGRVDAAWVVEPFAFQGIGAGMRSIFAPFEAVSPNLTIATYFANEQYIEQHGEIVDKFVRAMEKSLAYTQAHPEAARKAVLTYTKIPAVAAENMKLPNWKPPVQRRQHREDDRAGREVRLRGWGRRARRAHPALSTRVT